MDLNSACLTFQAVFQEVHQPSEFPIDDTSKIECVCSGGTCAQDKPVPILYLDREQAVRDWLEIAMDRSLGATILRWVSKPELIKFQITMADNKRGHRVVNDRYAVRSKFVVE